MNENEIIEKFLKNCSLTEQMLAQHEREVISILMQTVQLFEDTIDGIKTDVSQDTIGITILMVRTIQEYASSALSLVLSGQYKAAEIVTRTVVESAVNLLYVLQDDTAVRVADYIAEYHYQELVELDRWEKLSKKMENEIQRNIERRAITRKRTAIEASAQFFNPIAGIEFPRQRDVKKRDKNIGQKFRSLEREGEYLTIYAALCTQVHNAPEDLINNLLANVAYTMSGSSVFEKNVKDEQAEFAKILTFYGVGLYIETVVAFLHHYHLNQSAAQAQKHLDIISQFNRKASTHRLVRQNAFENSDVQPKTGTGEL